MCINCFHPTFLELKRLRLSGGLASQDAKDWCNKKAFHNLNGRQQPIVAFANLHELTLQFVRMRHIEATTKFIFKMSQNISYLEWWPPVDNFRSTCPEGELNQKRLCDNPKALQKLRYCIWQVNGIWLYLNCPLPCFQPRSSQPEDSPDLRRLSLVLL